jgi:cytochrome b involved in lipid metabolism
MAVKRAIYTVFIAFVASVATIGVLTLLSDSPKEFAAEKSRLISAPELARHNTVSDCWMAIEGNVYDVTRYIPMHPAAPKVITEWCGKEATEAFNTKGYGRPHSAAAHAMLPQHLVGKFSAT